MNDFEQFLRGIAVEFPERFAVQFRDTKLNYAKLVATLDGLAKKIGPIAGKRIVMLLPDGIPAYLCHLHFFLGKAVVVPVSVQTPGAKIKTLCDKVQPHFVVTNALLRARHKSALEGHACMVVKSEEAIGADGFDFEMTAGPAREVNTSEDVRLIVFTSGSTGEPKGVCLSEKNILSAAGMMVSFLELDASRKTLVTLPLYDYYGFIQIYGHILARSGYILGESIAVPNSIFAKIAEEKVTDVALVPHTLRELLKLGTGERADVIRRIKVMQSSSDALTPEVLAQAFAVNPASVVYNIYGLTEAGRAAYRRIDAKSPASRSIGKPSPGVTFSVEGPEGEAGEIVIKGPNVMLGYFQGIQEGRVAFKPYTEMRTGDLGQYDERGEIVLLGRRDHMFNIKGSKIHPAEIERIAAQARGVAEALARTRTDANGELAIYLEVVPENGKVDLAEVSALLRRQLPAVFFPKEITEVPSLKRTELGSKIIRRMEPV